MSKRGPGRPRKVGRPKKAPGAPVDNNAWHFAVFAYTASPRQCKLYVDGSLASTLTVPVAYGAYATGDLDIFNLGNGDMRFDEVGIWLNHALTSTEVTTLWNAGAGARPAGA